MGVWKLAGRKADQADRALAPHHLERLGERRRRYRRHQHAVRAAAGLFDDLRRRIGRFGIHRHVGAGRAGERELLLGHVERRDMQAHRLGVLHGELPEPADPGDRDPLARPRLGLLDALVSGDAGAKDRRHFREIRIVWATARHKARPDHVLGEAAVDAVAGIVLRLTEAVPSGHAILALATGIVQPGNARPDRPPSGR